MTLFNDLVAKHSRKLNPLILFLVGSAMAVLGWQKWADLLIDFGVQAYIPWQLSEGQVLYHEIFYFKGPLSVYLHALIFKAFGPGIRVLTIFNLFVIACLTWVIYILFRKLSDTATALLAGLIFIAVFGFGQYSGGGNYNYVTPYSYELTHGILLGFLGIHQLMKYMETRDISRNMAVGAITGLVFLTKPEVFLAAFVALTMGMLIAFGSEEISRRAMVKKVSVYFLSMGIPLLLFLIYFSIHMPFVEAVKGIFGQWTTTIGASDFRSMPFYKRVMGTDAPGENLATMALYGFIFSTMIAIPIFINHRLRNFFGYSTLVNILLFLITVGTIFILEKNFPLLEILKPLPLLLVGAGLYLLVIIKKNFRDRKTLIQKVPLLTLTAFSFVLLFKIILNTHVYHYGFALAMPGTLVIMLIIFSEIPLWLKNLSQTNNYYRSMILALILVFVYGHVNLSYHISQLKGYPVAKGGDVILDYWVELSPRGKIVQETLEYIQQETHSGQTLATFPDAIMMNYLTRRKNPTGILGFTPAIWKFLGEKYVLEALKKKPPDYILFISKDLSYFMAPTFGKDFGTDIYSWIIENYESKKLFGDNPLIQKGFGIQVFKKTKS